MVRHHLLQVVLVGSIPTPNFCEQLIKIRGWSWTHAPLKAPKRHPQNRRVFFMLKKRDLQDASILFSLLEDDAVKPYVREKADSVEEYYFALNKMIHDEEDGELISRTILDDWEQPIGAITLYDIQDGKGFLATWIGKPYFGKGYNQFAKETFLTELFTEKEIDIVFLKVNQLNIRSLKAMEKLSYAVNVTETFPSIVEQINTNERKYELFAIYKDAFTIYAYEQDQALREELEA